MGISMVGSPVRKANGSPGIILGRKKLKERITKIIMP